MRSRSELPIVEVVPRNAGPRRPVASVARRRRRLRRARAPMRFTSRDGEIRTRDLRVPNAAR
jgi:hypothetical protein